MTVDAFFQQIWQNRNLTAYGLWPVSLLYQAVVELRRLGYVTGLLGTEHFTQPILVFGNLTVGGSGKTPLTIWAANHLKEAGFSPGIISRGYGRRHPEQTRVVDATCTAEEVGDEPLVIWHATQLPVAVARRRADAIRILMKQCDCNIYLSDDGLQHLSLATDLKVLLIDGQERFGNGFCLPAGPLRERASRASAFDLTIVNGKGQANEYTMQCDLADVVNLYDSTRVTQLNTFINKPVFAFAGTRHPDRFFAMLKSHGIESENLAFPDHHEFTVHDFDLVTGSEKIVLMTEKDAVKCAEFAKPDWWYVKLEAKPETNFQNAFTEMVTRLSQR